MPSSSDVCSASCQSADRAGCMGETTSIGLIGRQDSTEQRDREAARLRIFDRDDRDDCADYAGLAATSRTVRNASASERIRFGSR